MSLENTKPLEKYKKPSFKWLINRSLCFLAAAQLSSVLLPSDQYTVPAKDPNLELQEKLELADSDGNLQLIHDDEINEMAENLALRTVTSFEEEKKKGKSLVLFLPETHDDQKQILFNILFSRHVTKLTQERNHALIYSLEFSEMDISGLITVKNSIEEQTKENKGNFASNYILSPDNKEMMGYMYDIKLAEIIGSNVPIVLSDANYINTNLEFYEPVQGRNASGTVIDPKDIKIIINSPTYQKIKHPDAEIDTTLLYAMDCPKGWFIRNVFMTEMLTQTIDHVQEPNLIIQQNGSGHVGDLIEDGLPTMTDLFHHPKASSTAIFPVTTKDNICRLPFEKIMATKTKDSKTKFTYTAFDIAQSNHWNTLCDMNHVPEYKMSTSTKRPN